MDNKILEILLDMQKDLKEVQSEVKDISKRLDKIEYKMNDGFETLEILSENNSNEVSKLRVKVIKVENKLKEINTLN
ncbi:hypothetical protein [Paraclostridium sordellii]|uniref:hypothetical protein n=1 Tax=Paraclostridium sordellii TaxID=1505 RepID=UPI0005E777D3|nr:hypothetical protein [Paeniclostridium sordellii]CEN26608.1 Uncharacterised protein [[Clostridium] sordellii] [Paeniclostridium sordellii]CEP43471.1 Uncharacterised protein [[Clostridium] sordellii] [Paeniclostridium sordellii]CEP50439.1 Uncharacterised protein [[Clostridium] sordellii] [Paeniclostridium sordellii]